MDNKFKIYKLIRVCCVLLLVIATCIVPVSATVVDETPYETYTYWNGEAIYCKATHEIKKVIDEGHLSFDIGQMRDVCCDKNGNLYVLDSMGSILLLDTQYKVKNIIKQINNDGEIIDYQGATGLYIDKNDRLYICDTENARIIVISLDGNYIKTITLPNSELIPDDFKFRPTKLVVDSKGYTYILSEGSYYGAILCSPTDEFVGFYGANNVGGNLLDVISNLFNKLFMTTEKRSRQDKKLPYTFVDLCIDSQNFVYTTTGKTDSTELSSVGQVKRLNPAGENVFKTEDYNYADLGTTQKAWGKSMVSDLLGITVDNQGFFYVLDSTYGRVFFYDEQSNLLSVFGTGFGKGDREGSFSLPCAIENYNDEIYVCDSNNNTITVFTMTEYGKLLKEADYLTLNGYFDESENKWNAVLNYDRNCRLAYSGLAKISYERENYSEAMAYAKDGEDKVLYGDAFEQERNNILKNNFTFIFIGLITLIGIVIAAIIYVKKKKIELIKNPKVKTLLAVPLQPFNTFQEIKYKGTGSVKLGILMICLYYISASLKESFGGFIWTAENNNQFNSLLLLIQTIGLVVLWTITNWAVATLFGGIGKIKEIFIVTSYSLTPLIIGNVLYIVLTNFLLPSEIGFLNIIMGAMTAYGGLLLTIGTLKIHDYEFGKFIGTTILTVIGMLIVVFVLIILILMIQQTYGFIQTLFNEIVTKVSGIFN